MKEYGLVLYCLSFSGEAVYFGNILHFLLTMFICYIDYR